VSYDLSTRWPGVLAHHDEGCPARLERPGPCGPLGYRGSVEDPERRERCSALPALDPSQVRGPRR
jgi:hypothetical protein